MHGLLPTDDENFPAGQTAHELLPTDAEYVPAAQAAHIPALVEKYPMGQGEQESEEKQDVPRVHVTEQLPEQSDSASCKEAVDAASLKNLPVGQSTQSALSSCKDGNVAASARYLPASQVVQAERAVDL